MSAECNKCGCYLIYPGDTWPVGECPRCDNIERYTSRSTDNEADDE